MKNPDYQNSKIYVITAEETDTIYIGCTTKKKLYQRMACHKYDHKMWSEGLGKYVSSCEMLKYPSAKITLIELYPCDTKEELLSREAYHINRNDKCINKYRPIVTPELKKELAKQYHIDNKIEINERGRQYHAINKDRINLRHRENYIEHKEEKSIYAKQYRIDNIDEIKQKYRNNAPEILAKQKIYTEKNKDKINAKRSVSIECGCGVNFTKSHSARHKKTPKHLEFMARNNV